MLEAVRVEDVWPVLEPLARELLVDQDETDADGLRAACERGEAFCFRGDNGYVVTRIQINQKTDKREYVVWVAISNHHEEDVLDSALPDIERMARHLHCANIVFYSPRIGWLRHGPKHGFRLRSAEFVREVL